MYTDDKNAQIILSLLKQYGIKKIVVSPGTTNVPISRSVQLDPWFEVYSVVDERSAAYFANGLAHSSGEPVVISCTGATASRNYLAGMTEAYYRNLPIIALTSQHYAGDYSSLAPQLTDRTISQNDVKKMSVLLPVIKDEEDYESCVIAANKALIAATTRGRGPVHINIHVASLSFTAESIPEVRRIEYYDSFELLNRSKELNKQIGVKKVCVFIGAHRRFSERSTRLLEQFSEAYKAPVFIDQTSGFRGKGAILVSKIADLKQSANKPDLIIDLGSVSGDYSIAWLKGIETWRLSEDGCVHDRFGNQTKLIDGSEDIFFEELTRVMPADNRPDYFDEIAREVSGIGIPFQAMPLSNTYISHRLSQSLPKNSNLHMGILNSLRNMNFYDLDPSVDASSNVGGFGIDGALSTLIGQSMADKTRINFGLVGDLAAFYDMNALGIRHVGDNVRILLVNNNGGVEFRLNQSIEAQWADASDEFISAGGHNGSIKGWAESMNFTYLSAESKTDFDEKINSFCSPKLNEYARPVLFEVFTKIPDEQRSIDLIQQTNRSSKESPENDIQTPVNETGVKSGLRRVAPESAKKMYRKLRNRD